MNKRKLKRNLDQAKNPSDAERVCQLLGAMMQLSHELSSIAGKYKGMQVKITFGDEQKIIVPETVIPDLNVQ